MQTCIICHMHTEFSLCDVSVIKNLIDGESILESL